MHTILHDRWGVAVRPDLRTPRPATGAASGHGAPGAAEATLRRYAAGFAAGRHIASTVRTRGCNGHITIGGVVVVHASHVSVLLLAADYTSGGGGTAIGVRWLEVLGRWSRGLQAMQWAARAGLLSDHCPTGGGRGRCSALHRLRLLRCLSFFLLSLHALLSLLSLLNHLSCGAVSADRCVFAPLRPQVPVLGGRPPC